MLFFLLLASDFHQGPELPVSPLSAMPAGRGPAVPPVGKGLGGSGRPLPVASGFHSAGSPASRKRVAGREPRPSRSRAKLQRCLLLEVLPDPRERVWAPTRGGAAASGCRALGSRSSPGGPEGALGMRLFGLPKIPRLCAALSA